MKKIWISLVIAVITASILSWFRGGIDDAPWIFAAFAAFGFFCSLLLFWVFRPVTLNWVDAAFQRVPHGSALRDVLALVASVSLVFWSGSVITSQGYAGWLCAFLFSIFCPLLICLLAARFSVAFGVLAATSIVVSVLLANARSGSPPRDHFWESFWRVDVGTWLAMWLIAVGLSMVVSIPIYVQRKRRNLAA